MAQSNFAYLATTTNETALPLALSVYADRAHLRGQIGDDAAMAGLRVVHAGDVAELFGGEEAALGDIVLVDCPGTDAATLAGLVRLDMRAAQAGTTLLVSTSLAALDDVFGCLDQSGAQILIDPSRAERALALGRALAERAGARVRELSDEDRLTLLRLTQQVSEIAQRLDQLAPPARDASASNNAHDSASDSVFRFESPSLAFAGAPGEDAGSARLVRPARPALPDPRMVRRMIRQRQLRARFFDGDLFADPAWDMLLDLTAARVEHGRVSVPACASPRACRPPPRCAGSGR